MVVSHVNRSLFNDDIPIIECKIYKYVYFYFVRLAIRCAANFLTIFFGEETPLPHTTLSHNRMILKQGNLHTIGSITSSAEKERVSSDEGIVSSRHTKKEEDDETVN